MKKNYRKNGNRRKGKLPITPNGKKNRGRVGKIRGDLAEIYVDELLCKLLSAGDISGFRKATEYENKNERTDFLVVLLSGKIIGIQVKSSLRGVTRFRKEEALHPLKKRPYPVMPFVAKPMMDAEVEKRSLLGELVNFEIFLTKTAVAIS